MFRKTILKDDELKRVTLKAFLKDFFLFSYRKLPLKLKNGIRFFRFIFFKGLIKPIHRHIIERTLFRPPILRPQTQSSTLPDYIIWGVIDWHFRYQRPQHLAKELSNYRRRVFYVSINFIEDCRSGFKIEALDQEGRLFNVKLYLKEPPIIYSSPPSDMAIKQLRGSIGELLRWANSCKLISLVQHPFWYEIASSLPNSRLIYDYIDYHEGFNNTPTEIDLLENKLFKNAYFIISASSYLDKIASKYSEKHAIIRNACEYEYFSSAPEKIYRDPKGRKILGYYGAIAEWFDQDLIKEVAKRFSNCLIMLIGQDTVNAKANLKIFPNIMFVGEVPYKDIPTYLYSFDVCLLPFKITPLTLATNPLKVYEYLSAGKTVVSVDLPEIYQFEGLVKVSRNAEEFLVEIKNAISLSINHEIIINRKNFAKKQTWQHRTEKLISLVENEDLDPKVSIVIVTYNNISLTKSCLYSLDKYSDYKNMEIVVVDNNSLDGTKEFLLEWVNSAYNRKLILNNENKGFAAANNQGINISSGEYLVLLNNDTYITPGWIRTLLNYLLQDNSIGLIGPITNNIGNEAKINLSYSNMKEMIQNSYNYTRRHIGEITHLRTLAFFCVMMSRKVFNLVGPLDESFGRGFFEDDDYCRRVELLDLSIVCAEDVFVHHHLSASFNMLEPQDKKNLFEENKARYESKWGKWVPHSSRKSTGYSSSH